MRDKILEDKTLMDRIITTNFGLPSSYELAVINRTYTNALYNLEAQLFPKPIRRNIEDIQKLTENDTSVGVLVRQIRGTSKTPVGAFIGGYNEEFDANVIAHGENCEDFDFETYCIEFIGALPADSHVLILRESLMKLALILAKFSNSYDVVLSTWENDKMMPVAKKFGFSKINYSPYNYENGDGVVVLKKDSLFLKETMGYLSDLVGKEWLRSYVGLGGVV